MTSPVREPRRSEAEPLRIAIISGSARSPRNGPAVASWVATELGTRTDARLDLIDAGEVSFPTYAELSPGARRDEDALAIRIAAADGYVVVTPEYNHGYPASLKQLLDSYYREWMFKPAMLVSYGVSGGVLAAEQLRPVFAELHVATTRRVVAVTSPWERITNDVFTPSAAERDALAVAWNELRWWATALRLQRDREPFHSGGRP